MPSCTKGKPRGARPAAAEALTRATRGARLGSRLACCGCLPGCGTVLLILLSLAILLTLFHYACSESLGGAIGWAETLAAKIGLTPGICAAFK